MAAISRWTAAVGQKFYEDGQVRHFPGNSILSMLAHGDRDAPVVAELHTLWQQFAGWPWARYYAFLPSASWHVTIFDLLCDEARSPDLWSDRFPLDAPLADLDDALAAAVTGIAPPAEIRLRYDYLVVERWVTVVWQPATEAIAADLQRYRRALAAATGIRRPNFDSYRFHLTLAYAIERLPPEVAAAAQQRERALRDRWQQLSLERVLPPPHLAFFDCMHAFHADKFRTARWRQTKSQT